ncbi:MAG TPA: hypothetical protein VLM18_07955 [Croceibacterium sp.]|nr:hypothetical protein [Croceibacterium sp.]
MARARNARLAIAAVFLVLGGRCLVAPGSVLELGVRADVRGHGPLEPLLMGCFGAQAVLAGLFAATARFTATTFAAYGSALLPFFVFDWYFYAVRPLFTEFVLLDAVGNAFMLALCVVGWKALAGTPDAA